MTASAARKVAEGKAEVSRSKDFNHLCRGIRSLTEKTSRKRKVKEQKKTSLSRPRKSISLWLTEMKKKGDGQAAWLADEPKSPNI